MPPLSALTQFLSWPLRILPEICFMAAESAAGGTSEAEAVESNRSPRKSSRRRLYGRQVAKS